MHQAEPTLRDSVNVVIIGGGLGGLAAAVRLASAGHDVTLCERGDSLGGRAREFRIGEHRWDAGPTVLTGPYLFDDLFAAAGRTFADYVTLLPVHPFYRVFGGRGQRIDYVGDIDELVSECRRIDPHSEPGVRALVARTVRLFEAFHPYTERHMMQPAAMIGMLPYMLRHRAFRSMRSMVHSCIQHPFLRGALEFHPLLIGGDPARTPALYGLICEFERRFGVHFAKGGTAAVVHAIETLLSELGVSIRLNCDVTAIETQHGKVVAVRTAKGDLIPATVVISNADPAPTRGMAHPYVKSRGRAATAWRFWQRPSMSLHVFFLGTSKSWPDSDLAHHSLLLPSLSQRGTDAVFHRRPVPATPHDRFLYVHLPSRTDPGAAPEQGESLYVLVAAPALKPGRIPEGRQAVRADVLTRLEPHLPGISNAIVAEHHIGPEYFRDALGSPAGQAFGQQPTLLQSAWFRPHNRQRRPRGLYLVGAGTHPGAGVPAVLASARIAADLVEQDLRAKSRRA